MRSCVSARLLGVGAQSIASDRVPAALKLLPQLGETKCPEHNKRWASRNRMFDP